MVKMWAEKEFRNLKRIHAAGIPCPRPIELKQHVILMELIGDENGKAAPKLKDIVLDGEDDDQWAKLYLQMILYMRIMYSQCRLVHGDLSEYNILHYQGKLWIIDVRQSIEHDHPRTLEFLRLDIKNINEFFGRKHVDILTDRTIFGFVTNPSGPREWQACEQRLEEIFADRSHEEPDNEAEKEVANEVFRKQFIPQTLEQVYNVEKDAEHVAEHGTVDLVYRTLLANSVPQTKATDLGDEKAEDDETSVDLETAGDLQDDEFSDEDKSQASSRDSTEGKANRGVK